jgi:hypothetical protein
MRAGPARGLLKGMGMDDIDAAEPIDRRRVALLGLWTTVLAVAFTFLLISDTVSATTF